MIRETSSNGLDMAIARAEEILRKQHDNAKGELRTTLSKWNNKEDNDKSAALLRNDTTGAKACIVKTPYGECNYSITYLTPDEADAKNRTYVFRSTNKDEYLLFLTLYKTQFFKPTKELTIDEVVTQGGTDELNAFFGGGFTFSTKEELEAEHLTHETAFFVPPHILDEEEELGKTFGEADRLSLVCAPNPKELSALTSISISNATDYAKAFEKYIGKKLTKVETFVVKREYLDILSHIFLLYATYEFFRTEDYHHLKDILSKYKDFGLPENWYSITNMHEIDTPETYAIAIYLGATCWGTLTENIPNTNFGLRDIAEYTHTPLGVIMRASKARSIWWE